MAKNNSKGFSAADFDDDEDDGYVDFSEIGPIDNNDVEDVHKPRKNTESKSAMQLMIEDLAKSGLKVEDLDSKPLDSNSRQTVNVRPNVLGYTIPYYTIHGSTLPHYRAKLFDHEPKYKQLKNKPNHIYFPVNFLANYESSGRKMIFLVEGEKKAALLAKHGYPACAVSGIDSWRNRYIQIPASFEAIPGESKNFLTFKVGDEGWNAEEYSGFAKMFDDLTNLLYRDGSKLMIVYDADPFGSKAYYSTQRAAAQLGFELRNRGVSLPNIRQVMLPNNTREKLGVDDYVVAKGIDEFKKLVNENLKLDVAFPIFPNIREYISKQLGRPRLARKQYQQICIALMSDLDRKGRRMYSLNEDQLYYFNRDNKHLMTIPLNDDSGSAINNTEFGRLMYNTYDISCTADSAVVKWLGSMAASEAPIADVTPSRMFSRPKPTEDIIRFQISDGQYIKITGNAEKPFQIMDNGDENVLFTSDNPFPVDAEELRKALAIVSNQPLKPWWFDVFRDVKLKEGQNAQAMALLYYISPWLYRWRGTQLPVEMICGESGSGKSTLISLRLNILTGQASLKNAPTDLKDWYASLSKTGGIHATDNLHFTDKVLAQRMSDEICRLVTEPNPTIEQRKYFTNTGLLRVPVDTVFAFTAIKQPFANADLIQRSFILELDKAQALNTSKDQLREKDYAFDSYWMQHQLDRFGGRAMWLAHHLFVLHKFFQLAQKEWDIKYKAEYRLINLEQIMVLMAKVFNLDPSWIPKYLATTTNTMISKADWVLEGLKAYADVIMRSNNPAKEFSASDMSQWFNAQEDYEDNQILTVPRALGRYLQTAKFNIATIAGIVESGKKANKQYYRCVRRKDPT